MRFFTLSWKYLSDQPLRFGLNTLMLSLGLGVVVLLLQLNHQVEDKLMRDAKGLDLVVGAKGSPLQLILCNIFHIDYPTGNIDLPEAHRITRHPLIEGAIPLALGDSYEGRRIVGTNHDYLKHFEAELAEGKAWKKNMDVTLGAKAAAELGLKINDTFAGNHGLTKEDGHSHDEHLFRVTGILKPTGRIIDELILCNVQSVWAVHDHAEEHPKATNDSTETSHDHEAHAHDDHNHEAHDHAAHEEHDHGEHDHAAHKHEAHSPKKNPKNKLKLPEGEGKEITAMLIKYRSPLAAVQLPRIINEQSNFQAAAPAFEIRKLQKQLGLGLTLLQTFAYVMMAIAALSLFATLLNALKERRYDLAILRSMGATQGGLFWLVQLEAFWVAGLSALLALLLGHGTLYLLAAYAPNAEWINPALWLPSEAYVLAVALGLAALTALFPAWQAYRTDISKVLARGR
jgi:putative ABC transport system permease protein